MKIGEIIAKIGELIAAVETSDTTATSNSQIQHPAGPTPVVIASTSSDNTPSPNGQTASGNDKEPKDVFLPPLQQKQELLKKAVGVDNIYDDGLPDDQQDSDEEMVAAQQDIVDRIKRLSGIPVAAVQELSNDDIVDD